MEKSNDTIKSKPYPDVTLEFNIPKHFFLANGDRVDSVTKYTGVVDKSRALMSWQEKLSREELLKRFRENGNLSEKDVIEATSLHRVRKEQAASLGTMAHDWCEHYALGEKQDLPSDPNVKNAVLAFLQWIEAEKFKIKMPEKHTYSKKYKYAGIADAVAMRNKKLALIDYKTSKGIYDEFRFQTAAYQNNLMEMGIDIEERWIVQFDKETGDFHPHLLDDFKKDFAAFLGCRAIVLRQNELKTW